MAQDQEPIVKLEADGEGTAVSYNVPEPTSYTGRNFIELIFGDEEDYFKSEVSQAPSEEDRTPWVGKDTGVVKEGILDGLTSGFADSKAFPNVRLTRGSLRLVEKPNPGYQVVSSMPIHSKLAALDPEEVTAMALQGKNLNVYRSMYGTLTFNYIPTPTQVRPSILLVETFRLSSYLGKYGAGRVIKTFTLLPGEKTTISVKTYRKTETDEKSASSILDSFTQESSDEFETSVQNEQTSQETYEKSFEYHADAEANASWGWGSASVSGGVSGSSNKSREESAKNVSSATEKHAASASSKREVQVETSYEVKTEEGEETSISRELQNINVSRTLNFVFRQMNQEFITILHLTDVRVAFFNGYAESKREVTLPELDSLLDEVVLEDKRDEVREAILTELLNLYDYKGDRQEFIEQREVSVRHPDGGTGTYKYWRVKRDMTSTYEDAATGTTVVVPGIILTADKHVVRTEGVIVESLLGQGEALDTYSQGLQTEAIRAKQIENEFNLAEVEKTRLGLQIVRQENTTAAGLYAQIFPVAEGEEEEESSE